MLRSAQPGEIATWMNRSDCGTAKSRIYLRPGEIWVGNRAVMVNMVLGSCVSLACFHPQTGIAGICHALQPRCPHPTQCDGTCKVRYRYTTCAVEAIIKKMVKYGIQRPDIEVKLFGGASLIGCQGWETNTRSVGRLNAEAAMETIQKFGLRFRVANIGGNFGRKIIFDTTTGIVLMKRLKGKPE